MENTTGIEADRSGATLRRPHPVSATPSYSSSSSPSFSAADDPLEPLESPTAYLPPPDPTFYPGQRRSLAGIALRAFCLGAALAVGVLLALVLAALPLLPPQALRPLLAPDTVAFLTPLWRLPFFLAALAAFHFLEFWTTARYNTPAATVGSFLLTANWPAYAVAHAAASFECLVRHTVLRGWGWRWWSGTNGSAAAWWWPPNTGALVVALGFAVVLGGQAVRTAAMARAGRSFNHTIQQRRAASHALVTDGIYGYLRHPSYFGFFWWALGTQLVLGNPVCFAGYAAVLWRFFSVRIRHEERLLVRFFGDDYVRYRQRVGTKIPFI